MEDIGEVPTPADWLRCMSMETWMAHKSDSAASALKSAQKFGGAAALYLPIHEWFDETLGWIPDARHGAIRHHSEGIQQAVTLFEPVELPNGTAVSVQKIGEHHVQLDLSEVPTAADWLRCMEAEPWMASNVHKRTSMKIDGKWVAPPKRKELT
jgi:hypothetical protein